MENKTFKEAIKSYLDERAGTDELFAKSYAKENKNLDECCSYIMGEARKRGNAVAMSDTEVFGLAVHTITMRTTSKSTNYLPPQEL